MKLTKRKGFNFFRSYYDVYNLLPQEDKIAFMDALLDRQFLGVKPESLKGMAKFAYVSQTNSIDSQVKGYEDKTRTKLNPLEVNNYTPTVGVNKKDLTPTLQVQVEVQEKEKEQYTIKDKFESEKLFLLDWNELRLKHLNKKSAIKVLDTDSREIFNDLIKNYSREEMQEAIVGLFKQKKLPNGNTSMQANPKHFLKFFNTYLTAFYDKNQELYGKEVAKEY
tara:strand:+ start:389 stop:1054 length:666 start_codon:yes stop_codon:yes gene_type:complete